MAAREYLGFDDRLLVIIGIPLLGFFIPIVFYDSSPTTLGWSGFLPHFLVALLYTTTYWLVSRAIVVFWRKRWPSLKKTTLRIAVTMTTLVAVVLLIEGLCRVSFGWTAVMEAGNMAKADRPFSQTAPISLLLVLSVMSMYEAMYYFQRYRNAELARERLLRSQVETQLDALSKQVDPHFLFNSLNTLVAIIPEDSAAAVKFTQRLSAVYRRLLDWRHAQFVSVRDELKALSDYNYLLAVRFEDQFYLDIDIDEDLLDHKIIPLALQILVENAVKHNEASRKHPLRISIRNSEETLIISNTLRPKPTRSNESTGFGLQNLRDRLQYQGDRKLVIRETETIFEVLMPVYAATGMDVEKSMSWNAS
jgi:sensor histidine kinase YesM